MTENEVPSQGVRDLAGRALSDFRAGRVSLRELIAALDEIWISVPESPWRTDLRGHWWTLEQVYAVAIDRDELGALPPDAINDIEEAVSGLEALVRQ